MKIQKTIIACVILLLFGCASLQAKNALVIIAHGSPSEKWNAPVLSLENEIKDILKERNISGFDYVRVALMEFTEPTIASVIKDCENEGIDRIYAVPLFIAPSGHSENDVPNILGIKYDVQMIDELKKEGASLVNTHIPITLGPTLSYNSIIKDIILDRVKEMSTRADEEALVLLAHGSPDYQSFWTKMITEAGNYILGKTGIQYFDYAFVEVGQSFKEKALPAIIQAGEKKKKVLVQGIYLVSGVKRMSEYVEEEIKNKGQDSVIAYLIPTNAVYGNYGLLPDAGKRISYWVADRAEEWLSKKID